MDHRRRPTVIALLLHFVAAVVACASLGLSPTPTRTAGNLPVVTAASTAAQLVSLRSGASIEVTDARATTPGDRHAPSFGPWALSSAGGATIAPPGVLLLPFDATSDTLAPFERAKHARARAPPQA
jgi:hypothetical protein